MTPQPGADLADHGIMFFGALPGVDVAANFARGGRVGEDGLSPCVLLRDPVGLGQAFGGFLVGHGDGR
jgi:hypothetical protein